MTIDSEVVGWVESAEGAEGDVYPYSKLRLVATTGMRPRFYSLITNLLRHRPEKVNGALVEIGPRVRALRRTEFARAMVTEFALPALDRRSKQRGRMSVTLLAEQVSRTTESGRKAILPLPAHKPWSLSQFRLEIQGIDSTRVSRLESLVFRRAVSLLRSRVGSGSLYQLVPERLELPELVVTLPQAASASWWRWHDGLVRGEEDVRSGTLDLWSADRRSRLFRIGFIGLRLRALGEQRLGPGAQNAPPVIAWLRMEGASFDFLR